MRYLVTADEMRRYDKYTSEVLNVPDIVLMERAASGAYDVLTGEIKDLTDPRLLVICGYGNNGGDGIALARMLFQHHYDVRVILAGDPDKASALNLKEISIAEAYGVSITEADVSEIADLAGNISRGKLHADVIIDALFGVGLSRPLREPYDILAEGINSSGAYIVSLDIPSGVCADGAGPDQICVNADLTITFGFIKLGQILYPGAEHCGKLVCVDMGIDEFSICDGRPRYRTITDFSDIGLPARRTFSNKGTYGKLLVIAGSDKICGAAYMASKAAFETGVGMIKLITHADNRESLQGMLPEAMYSFYDDNTPDEELKSDLEESSDWCDGILIGPGIGTGRTASILTRWALLDCDKPVLIDADALKICTDDVDIATALRSGRRSGVIMTPHLGELSYMSGKSVKEIRETLNVMPYEFADRMHVTIIAKDARSIIASSGCEAAVYVNTTGNNGMATAGSGDVLSGICAGLMVQNEGQPDLFETAVLAAYIHGSCGDAAAVEHGVRGMTATDIISAIRTVLGKD